jgi:hypothetical protein
MLARGLYPAPAVWSSGTTYQPGTVVTYLGTSYVAVSVNSATQPNTAAAAIWAKMSQGLNFSNAAWSSATTYYVGDVVFYNGASFVSRANNNLNQTPSSGSFWTQLAAAGTTGPAGPAGPGVAAGGTAGQLLTKNSSTDYDTSWQSASGVVAGTAPSHFTLWRSNTGTAGIYTDPVTSGGSLQLSTTLQGYPMRIPNACQLTQVHVNVTTAAGSTSSTIQVWLYTDNGQSHPGVMLASGSVPNGNGTGQFTASLSPNPTVISGPTNVWVMYRAVTGVAPTVAAGGVVQTDWTQLGGPNAVSAYYQFGVYTAGTAVPSDISGTPISSTGASAHPLFALRTSA